MSRYLRYIDKNETWRGEHTDRHIIDRFNETYDIIYDSDSFTPDPDAIGEFARASQNGDYDLIYCDEDVISDHHRIKPFFKPGYSPENERSLKYISGMIALKKGQTPSDLSGYAREKVFHIEKVLYHRDKERETPEPEASDPFVEKTEKKISVILLSKDHPDMLERCVRSLRAALISDDTELILIDNGSSKGCKRRYREISKEHGIIYRYRESEFNYSELNNFGVSQAKGDILVFMNDDIEVPESEKGVIEKLAARADLEDAGAVGIKLLYPGEEKIQHCGITLLYSGPSHKLQGYRDESYYKGYSDHDINALAVTGACLAVRKDRFEAVGGFDEKLPVAYNDVDLCLKLYEKGFYNICMNSHHLIHYEGATRTDDRKHREAYERLKSEREYFNAKHGELVDSGDPFMNKNITPYGLDFEINLPYEWELSGLSDVKDSYGRIRKKKGIHASLDRIDYRLADAYGNEDFYEVTGWIFKEGFCRMSPCVVIEGEGGRCVADTAGMRRPDVGEAFSRFKKSADSGFMARIPAKELERLGIKGEITVYPAFAGRNRRIYKGDEECQKKTEI
ncbi:MAG: glycosyltransferase [Lachnospiraceae bacterium]|nr:glycosyltransferase [Lachnospiraceae bacterium]